MFLFVFSYIYYQLLSVLTLSSLTKIFEQRKGYDLRKMIAGSERLLNSLSAAMDSDPSFMLSAVKVLPMPPSSRDPISNVISSTCAKVRLKQQMNGTMLICRNFPACL